VADPWTGTDADFDTTWTDVTAAVPGVLRTLLPSGEKVSGGA